MNPPPLTNRPILPVLVILLLVPWSSVRAELRAVKLLREGGEKLMREKSLREEAATRPCDHVFREMVLPARPSAGYTLVVRIYLTQSNWPRAATGSVTIKVRFGALGFAERSRALKPDEIALVWRTIYEEELFSLPVIQKEVSEPSESHVRDGTMVLFSHYEKRSHRTEEIVRSTDDSEPAARAMGKLAKPFADLVAQLEKVNPVK